MKKKDSNIEEQFEIKGRIKVTAEIANPGECRIVTNLDGDSGRQKRLMVGGRNWKDLSWNEIFNSKIVNKLFKDYNVNDLGVSPIIPNPETPSESIGMWISIKDDQTGRSYGDVVVREAAGNLLVVMFIAIACVQLTDKRGHTYTVSTLAGTKELYEDFVKRVDEEATEEMRNYFAFTGGLLEATVRTKAACPEKVFKYINEIIE